MNYTEPIIVTLPGERRVEARVRTHVIDTDQPPELGGKDIAPSPFELFLASIGTCVGIFVQGFCAKRGIDYRGVRIVQTAHYDGDETLARVELSLELPSHFPEKYKDALVHVVEQCSVKRAIAAQPVFEVTTHPMGEPSTASNPLSW